MSKFGELINAQVPVLFDFYTEWNEASVSMHPQLEMWQQLWVTKQKL